MNIIINTFISYFKKRKLLFYIMVFIIILPISLTLSRFVNKLTTNYYLETQKFYFNSDKLTEDNATYTLENWSGVENLSMDIQLESKKNQYEVADSDIDYLVSYTCEDGVMCSISKDSGTIYAATNVDSITLNLVPMRNFKDGESTKITVSAKSISPYSKTISATFIVKIGKKGISYEIKDKTYQTYLFFNITNAKSFYTVNQAFGNYSVNDMIDYTEYLLLNDSDKEKCTSSLINISFDPNVIILDTTNPILNEVNDENISTIEIDNTSYVNGIKFKMDALSSQAIRFYKKNTTKNYTYPIVNTSSIITVTSE